MSEMRRVGKRTHARELDRGRWGHSVGEGMTNLSRGLICVDCFHHPSRRCDGDVNRDVEGTARCFALLRLPSSHNFVSRASRACFAPCLRIPTAIVQSVTLQSSKFWSRLVA